MRCAYEQYVPRIGGEPGPMRTDYEAAIAEGAVWVETVPDLVGVLVLRTEPDHLLLENVAVRPDAQGRGIGRAMIDFAERRARDLGLPEVRLYTHVLMIENIALYTRLGYIETHRETEHGFTRAFFTKQVSN